MNIQKEWMESDFCRAIFLGLRGKGSTGVWCFCCLRIAANSRFSKTGLTGSKQTTQQPDEADSGPLVSDAFRKLFGLYGFLSRYTVVLNKMFSLNTTKFLSTL